MTSGKKHNLVTIKLALMLDDPSRKAVAFWDMGRYQTKVDPRTGEEIKTPDWIWLPRSQIEYEPTKMTVQVEGRVRDPVIFLVDMPDWLAEKQGISELAE